MTRVKEAVVARMRRSRRTFAIWRVLMAAALRASLQYRASFVSGTLGGILFQGVGMAFIAIVVQRFGQIGGWTLGEIALLYGMRLTSHALFTVPFARLFMIDLLVREGEFDRLLVRPVSPFVQLISSRFQIQIAGDLIAGVGILAAAIVWVPLSVSPAAIAYLLLALLGGALIELAIHLVIAGFSFRFISVRALRLVIDQIFSTFGGYPLTIFPSVARFALTFVIPVAFMAYLPATVLLDRTDEISVHASIAYAAPLVGFLLATAATVFWRRQIRHYQSTGH